MNLKRDSEMPRITTVVMSSFCSLPASGSVYCQNNETLHVSLNTNVYNESITGVGYRD